MEKLKFPIAITTLALFGYLLSIGWDIAFQLVYAFFIILTGMTIWMVVRILKDGIPPDTTFDDQWYEDV